jgi:hypothetical protein
MAFARFHLSPPAVQYHTNLRIAPYEELHDSAAQSPLSSVGFSRRLPFNKGKSAMSLQRGRFLTIGRRTGVKTGMGGQLDRAAVLRQQRVARLQRLRRGARGQCAFLLYLDAMTWEGRTGAQLAEEVGEVLQAGFPLLMLHECDPQRSSCEFERFFQVAAGVA